MSGSQMKPIREPTASERGDICTTRRSTAPERQDSYTSGTRVGGTCGHVPMVRGRVCPPLPLRKGGQDNSKGDIVPLCPSGRSQRRRGTSGGQCLICPRMGVGDGAGQVGDVVPARPAKATSPGGFGVSSLPLLHCDRAPGTHRPVQRTQPTGIQANAEGPLHCFGVDAAIRLAGPGRRAVGGPQAVAGTRTWAISSPAACVPRTSASFP